jgi:hypothetical protein
MSASPQQADIDQRLSQVSFGPRAAVSGCSKIFGYSITSPADAIRSGIMVGPSALAALRLITIL